MAWTDGIFGHPPDKNKILYIAKLCEASYDVSYADVVPPPANIRKVSSYDPPGVYAMEVSGQTVVVFPGTSVPGELASQSNGWNAPFPFPGGGQVNSYYSQLSRAAWLTCPDNTALFVGHSMGAALAMLAARSAKDAGLPVVGSVGIAGPRPVTQDALLAGVWPPSINVVSTGDFVPKLPVNTLFGPTWYTPAEQYILTPGRLTLSTQQQADAFVSFSNLFYDFTFYWHLPSTYIQYLEMPPPLSGNLGVPTMFAQFKINGQLMGQRVNNVLHYLITGNFGALAYAGAFQALWRAAVLPQVSDDYTVDSYECAIIAGIVPKNLVSTPLQPLWRYSDKAGVAGATQDKGRGTFVVSSSDSSPSFTAFGARKVCSAWQVGDGGTFGVPTGLLTKSPRGGIRLAGVMDGDTVDNSNKIIPDKITSLIASFTQLLSGTFAGLSPGVASYNMCVVTNKNQGQIITAPATTSGFGYWAAPVQGLIVNPYITSQVSRKQKASRLG